MSERSERNPRSSATAARSSTGPATSTPRSGHSRVTASAWDAVWSAVNEHLAPYGVQAGSLPELAAHRSKPLSELLHALGKSDPDGNRRLVVRPHAFNEDNANYDSEASELQFGYVFAKSDAGGRLQKGAVVHTALSDDRVDSP